MPSTVTKDSPLSRLNAVQPRMAKIQPSDGSALIDVNQPEILPIIRQTLLDVGLKHEAAAARANVKPSQFSAALNGTGNFAAAWLWAQEDYVLLRFIENVMEARRLTPEQAREVQRRRIVELVDLLTKELIA